MIVPFVISRLPSRAHRRLCADTGRVVHTCANESACARVNERDPRPGHDAVAVHHTVGRHADKLAQCFRSRVKERAECVLCCAHYACVRVCLLVYEQAACAACALGGACVRLPRRFQAVQSHCSRAC